MIRKVAAVMTAVVLLAAAGRSCNKPRVIYHAAVSCVRSYEWPTLDPEIRCGCTPIAPYGAQRENSSRWKYRWSVDESVWSRVVANGYQIRLVLRPDVERDTTTIACLVEIDEAMVAYGSVSLFIGRWLWGDK